MRKKIYGWSATGRAEDARFVAESLAELSSRLRAGGVEMTFEELPADLAGELLPPFEGGRIEECAEAIMGMGEEMGGPMGVSVFCDSDGPLGKAARRILPHALWGISLHGVLSLTYCGPNKFALWHETLHLLGAQDHYDLVTFGGTCELPTCLMQYAPSAGTVVAQRFLCQRMMAILRRSAAQDP